MKLFRTISVLALAFLVLVSSSSFMVGMHFCAGEVQHVALFEKAAGCEMEQSQPPCHRHLKAPCCEDETVVHKGEGFKISITDVSILPVAGLDIELPTVVLSEIIPAAPIARTQYYNYDPPLRSYDLTVSHRVFLI